MMNSGSGNEIVEEYVNWLKKNIKTKHIDDVVELSTPFLDNRNDHIQIYISRNDQGLIVSDDGDTIRELRSSGIELKGKMREKVIRTILSGLGVEIYGDELLAKADPQSLPQKVHDVIQASISIGDMHVLARPFTANLFKEDVESFLTENNVRFVPYVKLLGKSGIDQYFDFVIPQSRDKLERVVQAISRPTVQNAKMFIMSWFDTYGQTGRKSKGYAFLNDKDYEVKTEITNAFLKYEISPVMWSNRDDSLPELIG
jgi:hypothetical protein